MDRAQSKGHGGSSLGCIDLVIPPFRIQSVEFFTVQVLPYKPYVSSRVIDDLDVEVKLAEPCDIFVLATQQCFSEKLKVEGGLTRRNVIRHIREAYRRIYREARVLGVRSEMDSLRTLVVSSVRIERDETGLVIIPEVFSNSLE